MCTCISYTNGAFYFGRNLDLDSDFGQSVVITPRQYPITFKQMPPFKEHYAMIGMASVMAGYPMYAEAVNEKGLGMAGLNFPGNAFYPTGGNRRYTVTPYELIPWILGQCDTVDTAKRLLEAADVVGIPFTKDVPLASLHFMLSDGTCSLVVEPTAEGLKLYDNPFGVLTNNPPFPFHQMNVSQYLNLTSAEPTNQFGERLSLTSFGVGFGSIGLPGDASPASRFVRAAFLRANAKAIQNEQASVAQFFHMLANVAMVRGMVQNKKGQEEITRYSCCVNADTGVYYYTTYDNPQLQAVSMKQAELESQTLKVVPLETEMTPAAR